MVCCFEADASSLRGIYWHLRMARSGSKLRACYRSAAKEKGHLRGLGWDGEVIRLYCLHLRRPNDETRRARFVAALDQSMQLAFPF